MSRTTKTTKTEVQTPSPAELESTFERTTPEEVVQAYRATGVHPVAGVMFFKDTHACAVGVLRLASGLTREESRNEPMSRYETSFAAGFDFGRPRYSQLTPFGWQATQQESNPVAFADGQAARCAVKQNGLDKQAIL